MMKKCFCASCNIEKSSPNPFKLSGESPDFCKQCRAATVSYWAYSLRPSVNISIRKNVTRKRKEFKENNTGKPKYEPYNANKLSPDIMKQWKEEAQYRADVAVQDMEAKE